MDKGRVTCEIRPEGRNTRNSEGSFARTADGRIRFLYSRFDADTGADDAYADIAEIVSCDNGETWTEPRIVFRASDIPAKNIMSVTLLRLGNGDLGLFYIVKEFGVNDYIVMHRSKDDGDTWSEAKRCFADEGYFVLNNDRVIRLSTGRLLMPLGLHPAGGMKHYGIRSDALDIFYISDDDGETWRPSKSAVAYYNPYNPAGLQEPGVIELDNGVIWGYARTSLGRQYEFFSLDGGDTWTQAQPSQFTSPCSPLKIARSPFDGRLLAVWNPAPPYPTREYVGSRTDRTPLVYALSDGGMTFGEPEIIEQEPGHGYCYPAVFFLDAHTVLLSYCAGGVEDKGILNRTAIRKIRI